MKVVIDVRWDSEASVWYALAREKVGLATECESLDGLSRRILLVLPDVLDLEDASSLDIDLVVHGLAETPNAIAAE